MNKLTTEQRSQIIRCLVEGSSIRATCRMTGISKGAVTRLLVDTGRVCSEYQDKVFHDLTCKRIQCDEIWSFVGCKEAAKREGAEGDGDVWTWTAIDADTKLVPCWAVGPRDGGMAYHFIHDLHGCATGYSSLQTVTRPI